MESLLAAPDEDVVSLKRGGARSRPPTPRIEPSVACGRCGEPTQKSKLVIIGEQKLLPPLRRGGNRVKAFAQILSSRPAC